MDVNLRFYYNFIGHVSGLFYYYILMIIIIIIVITIRFNSKVQFFPFTCSSNNKVSISPYCFQPTRHMSGTTLLVSIDKIFQEHVHYNLRKYYFSNRVIQIWNGLPDSVVESNSINSSKNNLD